MFKEELFDKEPALGVSKTKSALNNTTIVPSTMQGNIKTSCVGLNNNEYHPKQVPTNFSNFDCAGIINARSVDEIYAEFSPLVKRINELLPFSEEEVQTLTTPLIKSFIAYALDLPASECYHHFENGGLVRHSLETAIFALVYAQAVSLELTLTPHEQREQMHDFMLLALVGGLLHDAGKVLTDLTILPVSGVKKQMKTKEDAQSAVKNGHNANDKTAVQVCNSISRSCMQKLVGANLKSKELYHFTPKEQMNGLAKVTAELASQPKTDHGLSRFQGESCNCSSVLKNTKSHNLEADNSVTVNVSTNEDLAWNPLACSLSSFLTEQQVTSYSFSYRIGRGKSHETLAQVMLDRIIPPNLLTLLLKNTDGLCELFAAITGSSKGKLYNLIKRADCQSVLSDLGSYRFGYHAPLRLNSAFDKFIMLMQDKLRRNSNLINTQNGIFFLVGSEVYLSLNTYVYLELLKPLLKAGVAISFKDKIEFYEALINRGIGAFRNPDMKLVVSSFVVVIDGYVYLKHGCKIVKPEYFLGTLSHLAPLPLVHPLIYKAYVEIVGLNTIELSKQTILPAGLNSFATCHQSCNFELKGQVETEDELKLATKKSLLENQVNTQHEHITFNAVENNDNTSTSIQEVNDDDTLTNDKGVLLTQCLKHLANQGYELTNPFTFFDAQTALKQQECKEQDNAVLDETEHANKVVVRAEPKDSLSNAEAVVQDKIDADVFYQKQTDIAISVQDKERNNNKNVHANNIKSSFKKPFVSVLDFSLDSIFLSGWAFISKSRSHELKFCSSELIKDREPHNLNLICALNSNATYGWSKYTSADTKVKSSMWFSSIHACYQENTWMLTFNAWQKIYNPYNSFAQTSTYLTQFLWQGHLFNIIDTNFNGHQAPMGECMLQGATTTYGIGNVKSREYFNKWENDITAACISVRLGQIYKLEVGSDKVDNKIDYSSCANACLEETWGSGQPFLNGIEVESQLNTLSFFQKNKNTGSRESLNKQLIVGAGESFPIESQAHHKSVMMLKNMAASYNTNLNRASVCVIKDKLKPIDSIFGGGFVYHNLEVALSAFGSQTSKAQMQLDSNIPNKGEDGGSHVSSTKLNPSRANLKSSTPNSQETSNLSNVQKNTEKNKSYDMKFVATDRYPPVDFFKLASNIGGIKSLSKEQQLLKQALFTEKSIKRRLAPSSFASTLAFSSDLEKEEQRVLQKSILAPLDNIAEVKQDEVCDESTHQLKTKSKRKNVKSNVLNKENNSVVESDKNPKAKCELSKTLITNTNSTKKSKTSSKAKTADSELDFDVNPMQMPNLQKPRLRDAKGRFMATKKS